MYVCVCVYIYIYISISLSLYLSLYIYIYTSMCICIYIYIYIYVFLDGYRCIHRCIIVLMSYHIYNILSCVIHGRSCSAAPARFFSQVHLHHFPFTAAFFSQVPLTATL